MFTTIHSLKKRVYKTLCTEFAIFFLSVNLCLHDQKHLSLNGHVVI